MTHAYCNKGIHFLADVIFKDWLVLVTADLVNNNEKTYNGPVFTKFLVKALALCVCLISLSIKQRRFLATHSSLGSGFAQIIGQILSIRIKILSKTNSVAPRHRKRQKALLPVDMRQRKTPLLKFSNLRRKDVDFPYSSSFTFVLLLFWVSQTHKLTGSRLRYGDVREAAIELTLHSILAAYALYPLAEILWWIFK